MFPLKLNCTVAFFHNLNRDGTNIDVTSLAQSFILPLGRFSFMLCFHQSEASKDAAVGALLYGATVGTVSVSIQNGEKCYSEKSFKKKHGGEKAFG